jgi:hypothetical protein
VVGEDGREVGGIVKPKLRCDRGDREIGVGKQAAGFEREPVLDGLFGCLAGGCVGGAGDCSSGIAQSVGVVGDVVGDREVAFEQVAKAALPAIVAAGARRLVSFDPRARPRTIALLSKRRTVACGVFARRLAQREVRGDR